MNLPHIEQLVSAHGQSNARPSHLGAVQGSDEARSKVYIRYTARVLDSMTQQCAKNNCGVLIIDQKQAVELRGRA